MTRWAFLGAGSMAGAMVHGLIARRVAGPQYISCISGSGRTAEALAQATGIHIAPSLAALVEGCDVLIIACKPQQLATLDPSLATLTADRLVVSVLAGKRLPTLTRYFPKARAVVRVMPNTPSQIGAGMSGWCASTALGEDDHATILALLHALGKEVEVKEHDMDALTAVAGSGPAYVFEFVAALREAGISAGLTPDAAGLLVQETVLGAAKLLAHAGATPDSLRDRVTSPNGTTAAALKVFGERDLRGMVAAAVAAAVRRSNELSADS